MSTAYYRTLESIHLKRMSVSDDDLAVVAHSFPNFKELVLVCCDGFGTGGLAVFVSACRSRSYLFSNLFHNLFRSVDYIHGFLFNLCFVDCFMLKFIAWIKID